MDKFSKKKRSDIMSRIHSANTEFEKTVFKEIKKTGFHFKKHYTGIIGKPDMALPKVKKAVFLHSDFWHGWHLSKWQHILPSIFWREKLIKNCKRDVKVRRVLKQQGWKVLVVWEHEINKDFLNASNKIRTFLTP